MNPLDSCFFSSQTLRAVELSALKDQRLSTDDLMEKAGKALLNCIQIYWPWIRRFVVICGKGNNAGDGYVLARLAHQAGFQVQIIAVYPKEALSPLVYRVAHACEELGILIKPFQADLLAHLSPPLIVEGLIGIGLSQKTNPLIDQAIQAINLCQTSVLAIDVPAGLDANTGYVAGKAIQAERTLTFLANKPGLMTGRGVQLAGEVVVDHLGCLSLLASHQPAARPMTKSLIASYLMPREKDNHKGHYGHVLLIGGDTGLLGALMLASLSCLRSGAGRVTAATGSKQIACLYGYCPEVMTRCITTIEDMKSWIQDIDCLAVGPGLGKRAWSQEVLCFLLSLVNQKPMVWDADALNFLANLPAKSIKKRGDWVLTPHPGEAARLLGISVKAVQSNRLKASFLLHKRYGGVIVLKGAGTIICDGKQAWIAPFAEPSMAVPGMGDVLTGLIAGLLAQGLSLLQSAQVGVLIHGFAAQSAIKHQGCSQRGLMASDLFSYFSYLLNPV